LREYGIEWSGIRDECDIETYRADCEATGDKHRWFDFVPVPNSFTKEWAALLEAEPSVACARPMTVDDYLTRTTFASADFGLVIEHSRPLPASAQHVVSGKEPRVLKRHIAEFVVAHFSGRGSVKAIDAGKHFAKYIIELRGEFTHDPACKETLRLNAFIVDEQDEASIYLTLEGSYESEVRSPSGRLLTTSFHSFDDDAALHQRLEDYLKVMATELKTDLQSRT